MPLSGSFVKCVNTPYLPPKVHFDCTMGANESNLNLGLKLNLLVIDYFEKQCHDEFIQRFKIICQKLGFIATYSEASPVALEATGEKRYPTVLVCRECSGCNRSHASSPTR